VSRREDKDILG